MFTISPSVIVQERDLTLSVVMLSNYIGATAGYAQWGPANKPFLITGGETELVSRFFKPDQNTYLDLLTAADFLAYSPKMWYNRVVGPLSRNAVEGGNNPVLVRNSDEVEAGTFTGTQWMAKYPGAIGNGLVVDVVDSSLFDAWEYKSSFSYKPALNEYAIAVIDSTGVWSGAGEAKQQERLSVFNPVNGGTKETRTITLTGAAAGGIQQVETLSFAGVSAGTAITVDGTPVTIAVSDTASVIAGKVATALAAVTATYQSAVASGANVTVTYKNAGLRTAIASGNSVGVTWSSSVYTYGDGTTTVTLYGRSFNVMSGDTPATVAAALAAQLTTQTSTYATVGVVGAVVTIQFFDFGVSTYPITAQISSGITATSAITVVGNDAVSLNVFGATVPVLNKDSAVTVATKIATALSAYGAFTSVYDSIAVDKSSVTYRKKVVGKAVAKASPVSQSGLDFIVDVKVPGTLGTLLEKFEIQTADKTARFPDGNTRYFYDAVNTTSAFIFIGDKTLPLANETVKLSGGVDDYTLNRIAALGDYANAEKMDLNYVWVAGSVMEQKAVADVVDSRRDAIAFFSPMFAQVVNNKGNELASVTNWRSIELNRDTSYAFNTDNWAQVYDKYNDVNRWIPTCGGTAGLLARTSQDVDPWISPAGHQRGRYMKYLKVAWSANKGQRDELYKIGVNSIIDIPAEGILLYGDKTSTSRPSAFSRINVRMAFIVAEKTIANFAKQFLFEINDPFTRSQFLNAVRPFLRGMVGRRAFEDFKVICDENNNGGQIRSENKMVGQILLKPLYSINYVILDFAAVRPDVTFEEIEQMLRN